MVDMLHDLLRQDPSSGTQCQFRGYKSFVRCLAHILNLIVKDILRELKSGTVQEANQICDHLKDTETTSTLSTKSALSRLRVLAIWISRSPQRREKWRKICVLMDRPERLIHYDVETRWNSTYEMLDTALQAKPQITEYLRMQSDLPNFTPEV